MELEFDRAANRKERIAFIRFYVKWLKSVPNKVWSEQQASFLDSLLVEDFPLGPESYLRMKKMAKKRRLPL